MRTFDLKPVPTPASVIGLGTMIFHPDTQERDHGLLDAFVDAGGTYVDTAEVYGAVEEHGWSHGPRSDAASSPTGARTTRATPTSCGCSIPPTTSGASGVFRNSPRRGT